MGDEDSRRFEQIVAQLHRQDPQFVTRVEKLRRPPGRAVAALCVLLWVSAPVMIAVGGWTGLLIAVAASGFGVYRFRLARASSARRLRQ